MKNHGNHKKNLLGMSRAAFTAGAPVICASIVKAHGGTGSARAGAQFMFTLPLEGVD